MNIIKIKWSAISLAFAISAILLLFTSTTVAGEVPECKDVPGAVTINGNNFALPESAPWDPNSKAWYVSNILGNAVSKIDEHGNVIEDWVTGVGFPVGMRVLDNKLYVVSSPFILIIDIPEAKIIKTFTIDNSLLNGGRLNDVVVDLDANAMYSTVFSFSSGLGGTIIKVDLDDDGSHAKQIIKPDSLGSLTNGILLCKDNLIVGSGNNFWRVDPNSGDSKLIGTTSFAVSGATGGAIDGIERESIDLLFTVNGDTADPIPSTLAKIQFKKDGSIEEKAICTFPIGTGAADIGFDKKNRVVSVPELFGLSVTLVPLDGIDKKDNCVQKKKKKCISKKIARCKSPGDKKAECAKQVRKQCAKRAKKKCSELICG